MAPGEKTPAQEQLKSFATALLKLNSSLPDLEVKSALFRRLRDEGFMVDPLAHEAVQAFAGRSGPLLTEAMRCVQERLLWEQVETYAASFFDMTVDNRREHWRLLSKACKSHQRLIDRLVWLRPGLTLERQEIMARSPLVSRMAHDLLKIFVERPEPRAVLTRKLVHSVRSDPSLTTADRSRAAKQLMKAYPEIAALSPAYLASFIVTKPAKQPKRRQPAGSNWLSRAVEPFVNMPKNGAAIRSLRLMGFLAAMAVYHLFLRPAFDSKPSRERAPGYTPPVYQQPVSVPEYGPLNPFELESFREILGRRILFELSLVGKTLDRPELNQVIWGLPIYEIRKNGAAPVTVSLEFAPVALRTRFIEELKTRLAATDLGLDAEQLDAVVRKCFPKPEPAAEP